MVRCARCAIENTDDSMFCKSCGTALSGPPPPQPASRAEDVGAQFGMAVERFGRDLQGSFDRALGIMVPVFMGFVGFAILLFFIFMLSYAAASSGHDRFQEDLVDLAWSYLWLLALLVFAGAFSSYFFRRYKTEYRWVAPLVNAGLLIGWVWLFSELQIIIGRDFDEPTATDIGLFLQDAILVIFVLALVAGFFFAVFSLGAPGWDKDERRYPRK